MSKKTPPPETNTPPAETTAPQDAGGNAAPGAERTALVDIELAPDAPPRIRLRALHPIRHDGTLYGPGAPDGDELSVLPAHADELEALRVVERLEETAE